jgi:hypothetical protein
MAILQALRAQYGFEEECEAHDAAVAGMDITEDGAEGMFEIGVAFAKRTGIDAPDSLSDLVAASPAEQDLFADMLALSWHHHDRNSLLQVALVASQLFHHSSWLQELPQDIGRRLDLLQQREIRALELAISHSS